MGAEASRCLAVGARPYCVICKAQKNSTVYTMLFFASFFLVFPHLISMTAEYSPGCARSGMYPSGVKHHMAGNVPKSKAFYKVSLCSSATVSTCAVRGNMSTGTAYCVP